MEAIAVGNVLELIGFLMETPARMAIVDGVTRQRADLLAHTNSLLRDAQSAPLSEAVLRVEIDSLVRAGVLGRTKGGLNLTDRGGKALGLVLYGPAIPTKRKKSKTRELL